MLSSIAVPGNVHDSVSFYKAYNALNDQFKDKIKNVCLDAAYATPPICREIISNKQVPLMSYKSLMTGKGFFKKYEYVYDEYYDCYICPANEILNYATTEKIDIKCINPIQINVKTVH